MQFIFEQNPIFTDYFCDYYDAQKKGYSGVAIYARKKPLRVIKGLGFDEIFTAI